MFFDRGLFKSNAKKALQRFYGTAVLVCLVAGLIGGGVNAIIEGSSSVKEATAELEAAQSGSLVVYSEDEPETLEAFAQGFSEDLEEGTAQSTAAFPLVLLAACFLAYPITIGESRYFLNARENPDKFGDVFFGFKKKYLKNVWTGFTYNLYTSLWSLLLFVPGIIKGYEYSMIPYILAENPEITRKEAYKMSKEMTKGYKGDLFVLDLSFIGWYLLVVLAAVLTCGLGAIGGIFLAPYISATKAEAYTFLKARAIETGKVEAAALPGFAPAALTDNTAVVDAAQ